MDAEQHIVEQNYILNVTGHLEVHNGVYHIVVNWYEDGKRKRQSRTTGLAIKGNRTKAKEMLHKAKLEKKRELANASASSGILFADFMEGWLSVIKKEVKITTYGGYQGNVRSVIVPYFREKGILLKDLSAEDINLFYDDCLERVKASTVHKYHANISKALKYAVKKGLITHSVMPQVDRPKLERFSAQFLKEADTIRLFDEVRGHWLELGVILALFYGLRRGEVVGLRWESIDFERNTITIEHTVTSATIDGKRTIVASDTAKTKSSLRTLPLVPVIRNMLLAVKAEQDRYRAICGRSYNAKESQYIYTDALGNRIHPDRLSREFPKFMEAHGFKRMRFHDLRHSCASLLLANGISLKQIQDWLGHSDFAITADIYAHLDYESKLEAANTMANGWLDKTVLATEVVCEESAAMPEVANG